MENAALRRGAGAGITGCLGRESTRDCNCERFYQFLERPTAGVAYKTLDNVGIARLCFEVADIEEVAAYLASKGVEFVGPVLPYETAPGVLPSGVRRDFCA